MNQELKEDDMSYLEGTCSYCGEKGHHPFPSNVTWLPKEERTALRTHNFSSPCDKLEKEIIRLREEQFSKMRRIND